MKKKKPVLIGILTFIILTIGYEYSVYLWSQNEMGAIIRVDIFIIYPIIIVLSALVFWISKKYLFKN